MAAALWFSDKLWLAYDEDSDGTNDGTLLSIFVFPPWIIHLKKGNYLETISSEGGGSATLLVLYKCVAVVSSWLLCSTPWCVLLSISVYCHRTLLTIIKFIYVYMSHVTEYIYVSHLPITGPSLWFQ